MNRTKVAIVHNLPAPYRISVFERLLDDPELEVKIFFTGKPRTNRPFWSADFRVEDPRIAYLPAVSFPLRGKSADKMNLNFFVGRVFSWKPDLILLDGYADPTNLIVAAMCWIKKVPYVLSAEISYVWTSSLTGKLFNMFGAPVVKRAAFLTPSSRSCALFFSHLGGNDSLMRIIPLMPDVQRYSSMCLSKRIESEQIRAKFGLTGKFVVLYVGRFEDYKGIRELLTAMDEVVSEDPSVSFAYVGNGSLENLVREKCESYPQNSLYLGGVTDETLVELFSVADIHVMPSWAEAYGIVCAEALSCGVPSIVTKTSGCSDLVLDGVNGFVIEPGKSESISRSILAVRSDSSLLEKMKDSAAHSFAGKSIPELYDSLKEVIAIVRVTEEQKTSSAASRS